MKDLAVTEHIELIKTWIALHVDATLEVVDSKEQLNGKLGRSYWRSETEKPLIRLPKHVSAKEIEDSLLALALRGRVKNRKELVCHADEIQSELDYLKHLVLHEVAHIKHDWGQDRETDCDLWVFEQMHEET